MAGSLEFAWRRYRRPFATPLQTAWGKWTVREGFILRVGDSRSGAASFGEVAPLPSFGSESAEAALKALKNIGGEVPMAGLRAMLPTLPPATAFGVWSALDGLSPSGDSPHKGGTHRPGTARTAALLPLDEDTPEAVGRLRESGKRVFKLKLGLAGNDHEWARLQKVFLALKPDERIRLDPNRSWNPGDWDFWKPRLNGLSERLDFVEEPFPAGMPPAELAALASASPVPFALDESLSAGNIGRWTGLDWPGFWIVKPSLLGDPAAWLSLLSSYKPRVILSSAVETGIGLSNLVRLAARFPETVHGLGVQSFFRDDWGVAECGEMIKAMEGREMESVWNTLPGA